MDERKKTAALNLSRDLCLKMVEHRSLGPEGLADALALLNTSALNLFAEINDDGGPLVLRLARDFTIKAIERKQISTPQDVAANFVENAHMVFNVAQKLPPKDAPQILSVAKDLVLKMQEVGRLSHTATPELFSKIASSL